MKSLLVLVLLFSLSAFGKEHTIVIEGMKFIPQSLVVNVGDTVTWMNKDFVPHTATSSDQTFNSKNIPANKSWKFVPKKAGKFSYKCSYHQPMIGELIVNSL